MFSLRDVASVSTARDLPAAKSNLSRRLWTATKPASYKAIVTVYAAFLNFWWQREQ
jgi:hypothetical protein